VLRLISFMDLTIAHMVLGHKRIALCLDALVMAHVLIVVIVLPCRHDFPARVSYTRFEPRHLDDPCFLHHGSCPTCSNGEVQKNVNTSSGRMVKN
jgi:hypothetical protein